MTTITTRRSIAAPAQSVFEAVAHIENFAEIQPGITNIEFLTESRTGEGTRFRETREMKGREATTTLEVTEYDRPNLVRLVADEGGTIWDTTFTVASEGDGSLLTMSMEARPHKLMAKLTVPLIKRMVANAVDADMDVVKQHCEAQADSTSST